MLSVFFLLVILSVNGDVIDAENTAISECVGSVVFPSHQDLMFSTSTTCIKGLRVTTKVIKQGCGCFKLHSRPMGRGGSDTLIENGEHELSISQVKSLYKISCTSEIRVNNMEDSDEENTNCIYIPATAELKRNITNPIDYKYHISINEDFENRTDQMTTQKKSRLENEQLDQTTKETQQGEQTNEKGLFFSTISPLDAKLVEPGNQNISKPESDSRISKNSSNKNFTNKKSDTALFIFWIVFSCIFWPSDEKPLGVEKDFDGKMQGVSKNADSLVTRFNDLDKNWQAPRVYLHADRASEESYTEIP